MHVLKIGPRSSALMALVNGDDVCMILDSDLSVVVALSDSGIDILVVCLIKCFASSLFPIPNGCKQWRKAKLSSSVLEVQSSTSIRITPVKIKIDPKSAKPTEMNVTKLGRGSLANYVINKVTCAIIKSKEPVIHIASSASQ